VKVVLLAGVKSTVVETQRADHAKEIVTGLSLSELQSFDGFVAVCSSLYTMLLLFAILSQNCRFKWKPVYLCCTLLQQSRLMVDACRKLCRRCKGSEIKVEILNAGVHLLQVGGDGLFQEMLNGLLAIRGAGGQVGQLAAHLRLGHIPAGGA